MSDTFVVNWTVRMIRIATIALLTSVLASSIPLSNAAARSEQVCPGLEGQARTDCLNREYAKAKAEAERAAANLERANRRMLQACNAAQALDNAATAATYLPDGRVRAAGRTWTSARQLSDAVLRQRGECERLRAEVRRLQQSRG